MLYLAAIMIVSGRKKNGNNAARFSGAAMRDEFTDLDLFRLYAASLIIPRNYAGFSCCTQRAFPYG